MLSDQVLLYKKDPKDFKKKKSDKWNLAILEVRWRLENTHHNCLRNYKEAGQPREQSKSGSDSMFALSTAAIS